MIPNQVETQPHGSSFRDPSGFVFYRGNTLYRQINPSYQDQYQHLVKTGFLEKLWDDRLLIPHQELDPNLSSDGNAYKVIQPTLVPFITYPYEWCFSQLKDAALLTLKIQKIALDNGLLLKDSSAFNIQFLAGKPILIDTLSFDIYKEGKSWEGYRQFCQHFLAPLSLMAYRDVRLSQLLRIYLDGIPLQLSARLLPFRAKFNLPILIHIFIHAASQAKYAGKTVNGHRKVSKVGLLGLIENLESAVRNLKWSPTGTAWSDYYEDHSYSPIALQNKKQIVSRYLDMIKPDNVWDLGANVGLFSRIASNQNIQTLAFDSDPAAVEKNYLECQSKNEINLLPVLMDFTNPSSALGWDNTERHSLFQRGPADTVMALALFHHLAISNNLPFKRIAQFFNRLGKKLIIEFIPKQDLQVQKLLANRVDIFSEYDQESFENTFTSYFQILQKSPLPESQRCIYLMESR